MTTNASEEALLEYAESKQPGTFHVERCLWDMHNIFYCPKCGLDWKTSDYNLVMASLVTGRIEYPDVILLRCYKERGGCGFIGKVKFNYPKEMFDSLRRALRNGEPQTQETKTTGQDTSSSEVEGS